MTWGLKWMITHYLAFYLNFAICSFWFEDMESSTLATTLLTLFRALIDFFSVSFFSSSFFLSVSSLPWTETLYVFVYSSILNSISNVVPYFWNCHLKIKLVSRLWVFLSNFCCYLLSPISEHAWRAKLCSVALNNGFHSKKNMLHKLAEYKERRKIVPSF